MKKYSTLKIVFLFIFLFVFLSFKDKAPTYIIPVYCGSDSLKEYPETIKRIEFNYEPQPLSNGVNVPVLDYITKEKELYIGGLLIDLETNDTTHITNVQLKTFGKESALFEVNGNKFSKNIASKNGKLLAMEDSYCVFSDILDKNLWKIIKNK